MRKDSASPADTARSASFAHGALDDLLVFRLRRIVDQLTISFRRSATERHGIRAGGFTALALIEANPGISQANLAHLSGYDPTVVVGIIDDLERRGWASRDRSNDRRRHKIVMTAAGQRALVLLVKQAHENEKMAKSALGAREYEHFDATLSKLYQTLFAK